MGFNIGDFIEGAVVGFLETGSPVGALAVGVLDGVTNTNPLQQMGGDALLSGPGSNPMSMLMEFEQLAQASGGG